MIDVPMYKLLYEAELVVADLSTTNPNAIFELGVRYALKPRATIIIAESKFTIPFDATHIAINRYEHLGSSIDYAEAIRMQNVVTRLIAALPGNPDPDSPVYTILHGLNAPTMIQVAAAAAKAGAPAGFGIARAAIAGIAQPQAQPQVESYATKLQTALDALNDGAFGFAKKLLLAIYNDQTAELDADQKPKPARPFVVQRLALATYKAGEAAGGPDKALAGYAEAERLLSQLDVETTTDPETLGQWSAIHKKRAQIPGRTEDEIRADVAEAIQASERGFLIKRDYYNGTNLAYLFNLRASISSGDDKIADNVFAARVRRMVVRIAEDKLALIDAQQAPAGSDEAKSLAAERYWAAATRAESLIALGDPTGEGLMDETLKAAPTAWMAESTRIQLASLRALLAKAHAQG
jgi:hypothetical protein